MEAPVRYAALFLSPERTPENYWISLRYFNLYRIALAALFLGISLAYGELNLGSHNLALFRGVSAAYLVLGVAFDAVLRNHRENFNMQLSAHACVDIVAITLLMYASGGIRSGLGVMMLISLTAAAIVAPRRLTFLYAALASIALLLEQGYWVLVHDAHTAAFLQPGLVSIACFATAGATGWLAQRVSANERLARQRGREVEMRTRLNQLVIEDMHDGIAVLDRAGRVVQHNPQAQRLLAVEELRGVDISELLPGFAAPWREWRASKGAMPGRGELAVGGRELGLRLLNTGTEEEFSVLFIEDMTRSREQAQQLKLAALGRLTASIAHEIRNPLAAISHAAELMEEEKRTKERERLNRIIHDNTLRLERLVSDVLQLNRRDRTSAELIRLNSWLPAFVDEFVANEGVPRERFVIETRRDASIQFDREHLRQVLWNLLGNAVRYARAEPKSVRIALGRFADRVELSVIDNGPGVAPAAQGQLFEPFFTTEAKGTGLGLYLARELCAANRAILEYVADMPGAHFRILAREAHPA